MTDKYDGDDRESRTAFRAYDSVSEPVSGRTSWQIWRDACAWQAARATAEQRDSVIEEWIEETCAAYCIPKPFSIIDAIRALKSQQDAAIESKPAEQSEDRPVEIWHGARKVTIHSDCVLRVWGENIATEMSDEPRTLQSVQEAVDWLYVDAAIESQRSGDGS